MSFIKLDAKIYNLKTGINKLIDHCQELLGVLEEGIEFSMLSGYDKMKLKSELYSDLLLISSLGESLELDITRSFTNYNMYGKDLRLHSQSMRMIFDIEMVAEQIEVALGFLIKSEAETREYQTIRRSWVKSAIHSCRYLLYNLVGIFNTENQERCDFSTQIENVGELENTLDALYKQYSVGLIDMVRAELIDIDHAFYLTSSIRSLERVGDLVCQMIGYAINIHTNEEIEL